MQGQEQSNKVTMRSIGYEEARVNSLLKHELLEVNLVSLKQDFEQVYSKVLDQDLNLPQDQLLNLKTDLFSAFCYGAATATDTRSNFRRQYKLPKKVMENINKIVVPDKKIIT